MNEDWTWVILLGLPFVLQYILTPVIIRFTTSHPASPEFDPAAFGQLPPDVGSNFSRFVYAMNAEGFVLVGFFRQLAYMRGVGFYLTLMKSPAQGDMVYLIDMSATNGIANMRTSFIEFCTDYADGNDVCTNNVQRPSAHKWDPQMKVFRFPEVLNPHFLYQLHRRLCAKHATGVAPVPAADGMEVFRLSYGTVKEVRKQAELGYYYLDESKDVFRTTWKGAYLMTWRLAWPVGAIRKSRMRKQGRALMRELGC